MDPVVYDERPTRHPSEAAIDEADGPEVEGISPKRARLLQDWLHVRQSSLFGTTPRPATAARAQLIKKRHPSEDEYAELGGMSDEAIHAKTGKTWRGWVEALDAINATSKPHREIAEHLFESFESVSDWWAQTITVGYERIRGLREHGQRRGGGFDVNKSKTIPVPVAVLYEGWVNEERRTQWLPGAELEIRKATPNKSIRARWGNGTALEAYFTAKGDAKSTVSLPHRELPDKKTADDTRAFWTERLAALAGLLTMNGDDE